MEANEFYDEDMFNINRFNKKFDEKIMEQEIENDKLLKNKIEEEKNKQQDYFYDKSIGKILIDMKDNIIGIFSDLISGKGFSSFTKDNRLFYLGVFLLLTIIIVEFFNNLIQNPINLNNEIIKESNNQPIINTYVSLPSNEPIIQPPSNPVIVQQPTNNQLNTNDSQNIPANNPPNTNDSQNIQENKQMGAINSNMFNGLFDWFE